jgi:hypothetical protein
MNKNVGEDVSGWETRGQEKKTYYLALFQE